VAAGIGTLIFGGVFALLAVPDMAIWLVVLICMASTAGTMISAPTLWSHPSHAPETPRPLYLGVSQASFGVGVALGPILGIALYGRIGLAAWLAVALLGALSAWAGFSGVGHRPGTGHPMHLRIDGSKIRSAANDSAVA
jgi:predicted MFS family arabinose efflux permease